MASLSKYFCFVILIIALSCEVTKPVKNGTMAYEVKQYAVAVELFEEELKNEDNRQEKARKSYLLAKSYDILQRFPEALKWYDIADQLSDNLNATIDLAHALKKNERYKEAEQLFREIYQQSNDRNHLTQAEICRQAVLSISSDPQAIISPFKANSRFSDYSPVYFEDDFIVFSSDREETTGKEIYNWSGNKFHDLFIVNNRGRLPQNFDALINTEANEGAACFSKDFNEIYFTRCTPIEQGGVYCRIFYSQRPNGFWMEPEPMLFFDDNTNFGQPCLIENDSVLIFSASVKGANHDLYYSVRLENGWSPAELMPSSINTEGNENFPSAYGDTLFFASDRLPGYGGYDIFRTHLQADGSWSRPVNLGVPVNSGADDFGVAIKDDFKPGNDIVLQGLFSSSRNTGFGDDIFGFTIYKREEIEEEPPVVETKKQKYNIYLSVKVVELLHLNGDPNEEIIDKIPLEDARVKISNVNTSEDLFTDAKGRAITRLEEGENYTVLASLVDYLNDSEKVSTTFVDSLSADTTINIELGLDKIVYDKEIVLNNIYYDFEKWDIRPDARPTLDSLSQLLNDNPQLDIQLSSHTDCRGDDMFNANLSQKRAQSAVDYLIANGVEADKLTAKGYGETTPAVDCECSECTEEEHQINRRTTFKILKDR